MPPLTDEPNFRPDDSEAFRQEVFKASHTYKAGTPINDIIRDLRLVEHFRRNSRRLCDLIVAGSIGPPPHTNVRPLEKQCALLVRNLLSNRKAETFFVDEIAEGISSPQGCIDTLDSTPKVMLPFKHTWVEFQVRVPWINEYAGLGILCYERTKEMTEREGHRGLPAAPEGHRDLCFITFASLNPALINPEQKFIHQMGGAVLGPIAWTRIRVDAEGTIVPFVDEGHTYEPGNPSGATWFMYLPGGQKTTVSSKALMTGLAESQRTSDVGYFIEMAMLGTAVAVRTFGLLNCKNIVAEESPIQLNSDVPAATRQRQQRGLFRYKVLKVIAPGRKRQSSSGSRGDLTGDMPLHIVRGHFRDYRDGKGLFGKLKGMYWWPAHARGTKEAGVIEKDYTVKEGAK